LAFTRLLMQLEECFGFNVAIEELGIEDFRSINTIARLVADNKQESTATDVVCES
jgi:acyl carrier protein